MNTTTVSFYDLATGLFTGAVYSGPEAWLADNTPAGCGATPGVHAHLCRRLNLATGQVEPWQPPAPDPTELCTWAWCATTERWLPQPTLAAQRLQAIAPVQAAIEQAEAAQARPLRELMAALLASQPAPAAAAAQLATVTDRINALRAVRAAMASATSAQQLAAITWS